MRGIYVGDNSVRFSMQAGPIHEDKLELIQQTVRLPTSKPSDFFQAIMVNDVQHV